MEGIQTLEVIGFLSLHGFWWRATNFFLPKNALHGFSWRVRSPPRFFSAGRAAKNDVCSAFLRSNSHGRCNIVFFLRSVFLLLCFSCCFAPLRGVFRGGLAALHDFLEGLRQSGPPRLFFSTLHGFSWRVFDPPRLRGGYLEEKKSLRIRGVDNDMLGRRKIIMK